MSLPVIWSPASKDEYADLLAYVESNFGLDSALNLLDKTERIIENISEYPESFPASEKSPSIRKAVVTKQTSLFLELPDRTFNYFTFGTIGEIQTRWSF